MSLDPLHPSHLRAREIENLRRYWFWFLVLGLAQVFVGFLAFGAPLITGLALELALGILLLVGGIVQLVNAFPARNWRGFLGNLLSALLYLVAGVLLIDHPVRGLFALTWLLSIAFMVSGLIRIVASLTDRFAGWAWVLLSGVISFLLGLAIWRMWREDSPWIIGLFVGIELIFNGWAMVMLALIVKPAAPPPAYPSDPNLPPQPGGFRQP